MAIAARMVKLLDEQDDDLASYEGINKFTYWFLVENGSVTVTPEIQGDLKEFVRIFYHTLTSTI